MSPHDADRLAADLLEHQGFLRRAARELVGERDADDAAQDAWVVALSRSGSRPGAPRAWLRAVLRNRGASRAERDRRRADRERLAAREEGLPGADELEQRLELVRRVADAVRALPEPYRRAIYLRTYEDRGPTEIARELDVPLETVHSRLRRGRALLRERLDAEYGGRAGWALALASMTDARWTAPVLAPPAGGLTSSIGIGALLMSTKFATVAAIAVMAAAALWIWEPWRAERTSAPVSSLQGGEAMASQAIEEPRASAIDEPELERDAPAARAALAPPEEATTGALHLRVRFATDGSPAGGLRGTIWPDFEARAPLVLDARGEARSEALAPGNVDVELNGYGTWVVHVVAGETTTAELALEEGITVRGRVLGPDDVPVPGAEVFSAREGDRPGRDVVTTAGPGGWFVARDLAPWRQSGPWTTLAARAPGYGTSRGWEAMGPAGAEVELVLRLERRAGALRGRVVSHRGEPVSGAELQAFPAGVGSTSAVSEEGVELAEVPALVMHTDARGEFACDTLPPGRTALRVNTGRHPERGLFVEIAAGETQQLEIELEDGGALVGTVRDADGGPLADISVSVDSLNEHRRRYATTDAAGAYRFEGLPAGLVRVGVRSNRGTAAGEAMVPIGATATLDLTLVAGARLAGTVVDERGAPLVAHHVCVVEPDRPGLWLRQAMTDEHGRFELTELPDGPKAIELRLPAPFASAPLLAIPWPTELDERGEARLVVPDANLPTASVAGRVLDAEDRPVEGVELWLSKPDSSWGRQDFPGLEDQRFRYETLVSGDYLLAVSAPGFADVEVEVAGLAPREARDLGVVRLARGGAVRVELTQGGAPCEDLDSAALEPAGGGERLRIEVSGAVAHSGHVPPGEYELCLSGRSIAAQILPVTVVAGETTRLEAELAPGTFAALQLVPAPAEGEAPPRVELFDAAGRRFRGELSQWGEFVTVTGLALGEWRAVVHEADGRTVEARFSIVSLDPPAEPIPIAR